jgi:hypothetical protein
MHGLMRWVLKPIACTWTGILRSGFTIPRPTDAPHAHSSGVNDDRILVFGGGPALGWGVSTQGLALPGSLARALTARTQRGAYVDVVAARPDTVRSALGAIEGLKPWRYDAIVVTLGVNEALNLTSVRLWRRTLRELLPRLERDSFQTTQILVVGILPIRSIPVFDCLLGTIADRHARALNRELSEICAQLPRTTYVPLTAFPIRSSDRNRAPLDFSRFAEVIAESITTRMGANRHETEDVRRPAAYDAEAYEQDRQRAVDKLADLVADERFEHILALAKQSFGTDAAAFTVIDRDRQVIKSGVGPGLMDISREDSFCATTIGGRGALVVPDARADPRFRNSSLVTGEARIRFYAGFPIESPSGERIGALCLVDSAPRRMGQADLVLLRELALMLQRELWRSAT